MTPSLPPATAARAYIATGMAQIEGWFFPPDAQLFTLVNRAQERAQIDGDLLEIGVYLGRSAVLLGFLRRPDERFLVCDVFGSATGSAESEAEQSRFYQGLALDRFTENYRKFHPDLPDIHVGLSSDLHDLDLTQTFRLIHIDGSHAYADVRTDIALARRLLRPGGVVVFDDMCTPHAPGVAAAVWEAVANDGLVPLALTGKLYATFGEPGELAAHLGDLVATEPGLDAYAHRVADHELLEVKLKPTKRSPVSRLARSVLPPIADRAIRRLRGGAR